MSIIYSKPSYSKQPTIQPVERTIPGSDIKIVFTFQGNHPHKPILQATVHTKNETKTIPNVPMDSILSNLSDITNTNHILQRLKERALDYVFNEIIFLPESPFSLFNQWRKQAEATNNIKEQEKLRALTRPLKKSVQFLKNSSRIKKQSVTAYLELGNTYFGESHYKDALLCYQQLFIAANSLTEKDWDGMRLAHRSLGLVYHKLGEMDRAIYHCTKDREISRKFFPKDPLIEGEALCNLGNIYESMSDSKKALIFYKIYLDILLKVKQAAPEHFDDSLLAYAYASLGHAYRGSNDYVKAEDYYQQSLGILENSVALNGLGNMYKHQGKYKKAIGCLERALKITSNLSDQGDIYANLGLCYQALGRHSEARQYFLKDQTLADQIGVAESKARAYYHLSQSYIMQGHYKKGIEWLGKAEPLADHIKDSELKGMIYSIIAYVYYKTQKPEEAIYYFERYLKSAEELQDLEGQSIAHIDLGNTYFISDQEEKAIEHYQKARKIAEQANDIEGLAIAYFNIGRAYQSLMKYPEAINHFEGSINFYSELREQNCKENVQWQVSFFESQYKPYRYLEKALREMNKANDALLVADMSRSRALVDLLGKKLNILTQEKLDLSAMQEAAIRFQTTFIMYTCDPLDDAKAWCWVISPNQTPTHHEFNLEQIRNSVLQFDDSHEVSRGPLNTDIPLKGEKLQNAISTYIVDIEKDACRGGPEGDFTEEKQKSFESLLKSGYQDLIEPIASLLPRNGARITIIPDAFLHDLPFALFQDSANSYLFEKCTLTIVPSIETLLRIEALDNKNRPHRISRSISIITNAESYPDYGLPELQGAKEEGESIAQLFRQESPPAQPLPISEVKSRLIQSGRLHLACHGLASEKENEHSVFEGALVMRDGLLYSEDIHALSLNAELAFLSACHSGQGKIHQEGSVGLPFAFLSAGVSSVIATRWKIFDRATKEIAKEFYRHYLGKSEQAQPALQEGKPFGQAEALREAMLFAKQEYPNKPHVWGAFFLAGLPGKIANERLTNGHDGENVSATQLWTDEAAGNQFYFSLQDGVITTKFLKKNSSGKYEEIRIIPESDILIHTISLAQTRAGIKQVTLSVQQLTPTQKEELMDSLLLKKIRIKDQQLIIYQP